MKNLKIFGLAAMVVVVAAVGLVIGWPAIQQLRESADSQEAVAYLNNQSANVSGPPGVAHRPDWACTQYTYSPGGMGMGGMDGPPGIAGVAGWICSQWTYSPKR